MWIYCAHPYTHTFGERGKEQKNGNQHVCDGDGREIKHYNGRLFWHFAKNKIKHREKKSAPKIFTLDKYRSVLRANMCVMFSFLFFLSQKIRFFHSTCYRNGSIRRHSDGIGIALDNLFLMLNHQWLCENQLILDSVASLLGLLNFRIHTQQPK